MAPEVQLETGLGLVNFSQVGLRGFYKIAKILRFFFFTWLMRGEGRCFKPAKPEPK